jgi:uncharacterized Rossmann fold enzyme
MYHIWRSHSSDSGPHIIKTVETSKEAKAVIKAEITDLDKSVSTPHNITRRESVTVIHFNGENTKWQIAYWITRS